MPQKITKEEAQALGRRPLGKKHPARSWLENIEKGEIIYITRAEFKWKNRTPKIFIDKIENAGNKRFSIVESINRMGWVVERVA